MSRKDHARVLKLAVQRGAKVEQRTSGHTRVWLPNGNYVTTSTSPSDHNAGKQLARDLKRAGLDIYA